MATRHEIISIDFRANAAKANPAMDSLREAAKGMNVEIEKTKEAIANGIKTGMPKAELDALGATLTTQEKKLKSFETAMASLSKGVGTLSRAIDAFNNGSLQNMSAAFQKASYNAAENAKKALLPGSKDYEKNMAELDALQQKNLENLAKYKLRTEQMLQSIADGGKISSQDLKQEADGIQELMRLLPHMGHEWMEYHGILERVNAEIQRQADSEKRLKGAIVDSDDARREMVKLTKEGAEAARQKQEQAEQELTALQKERDALKQNRAEIEQQIADTRDLVAEREKALKKQEKTVKGLESQRDALAARKADEHDLMNVSRQNAETLRESVQQQTENLDLQKKKTAELDAEVKQLTADIEKMGKTEVKPKVDTSEIERLKEEARLASEEYKNLQEKHQALNEEYRTAYARAESVKKENFANNGAEYDRREAQAYLIAQFKKFGFETADNVYNLGNDTLKKVVELFAKRYELDFKTAEGEIKMITGQERGGLIKQGGFHTQFGQYNSFVEVDQQAVKEWDDHRRTALQDEKRLSAECDEVLNQLTVSKKKSEEATRRLAQAQQQSTTATTAQTDAIKAQEQELEKLDKKLADANADLTRSQGNLEKSLEPLKELGLAEGDLEDKAKLREAAEKKVLEIMEAQARVEKDVAEQSRQLIAELKPTALGGTKADHDYYITNRKNWDLDQYQDIDAVMARITHLEHVSKLKNGKRFSDDTEWTPDNDFDLEEDLVMSDKEKQAALDELRILKQHVREQILQTIREVGDIDKAVEQSTGGDGVDEDSKFGQQLNDKIDELKEKIHDQIKTSLEYYEDILDDVDRDEKMSKEEVTRRVNGHIENLTDNVARDHDDVDYFKGQIDQTKAAIEAKKQLIAQMKEQAQAQQQEIHATEAAADADEELAKKKETLAKKQEELSLSKANETRMEQELAETKQKSKTADEEAEKAERQYANAVKDNESQLQLEKKGLEEKDKALGEVNATLREQQQKLADNGKAEDENAAKTVSAEKKKAEAQQLTIKRMEEMLAALKKANHDDIPANTEKWRENEQEINRLTDALEKMKEAARLDQIELKGKEALSFFSDKDATTGKTRADNASVDEIGENLKALTAYRDVLPSDGNVDRIDRINQLLEEQTQHAKELSGEWMSLAKAEELASRAGTDGFFATSQQMQQAVQAIERQRDALVKTIQQKQNDGKATKEEEAELQRLEKVLKDLKFEQDNFNMSHKRMNDLLKEPKSAEDLDQLKAAIKRADGELHRMKQSLGENNKEYQKFAADVKNAKNVLKEMEGQAKATTSAFSKALSRLKTYVGLYMGFNIVWQKFTGTIGDMKELSDRMGEVGKTTQMTSQEIARLTTNLAKLDTRTTLNSLVELSAKAGQLGLKSIEDVQGFTEAANKMLVALPEMGAEGATQMMKVALATGEVKKIQKEMDEGLVEGSSATAVAMEKIASTIDQLRANSAAAAPQITDFVKRVGAVGAQSGITIDQVAALGSTVDALGMRVEMSATALSRMIPAIKNNAFEVAKAIGMAPEALRQMFDEAGGGMQAMLAIFQHIKDQGMDADSIEKMLNMGGMQDVMKQLNQQGARAGIVFAGLSQNVDVLREHLGIAKNAYEENIAIQQEYDRMNETTAAKWERLGNQIEEMIVGPDSQSVLGDIADMLRVIVDLVSGPLNTAFWSTTLAVTAIKTGLTEIPGKVGSVFDYLKESAEKASEALSAAANATSEIAEAAEGVEETADVVGDIGDALDEAKEAGEQAGEAMETATGAIESMTGATKVSIFSVKGLKTAWKGLDATMKANIIVAVVALLYTLGKALYNVLTETNKYNKAVADANAMIQIATDRFEGYWEKLKETKTALDSARKSTEGLKEGSDELTKATINVTKADNAHKTAIADINSIYGKYLGFMLTEQNYALLNAAAHDKVTAAIRREMLAKQQQAAIDQVTQENTENLKDGLANLTEELREDGRLNTEQAAQAKRAAQQFMRENIKFNTDKQEYEISQSAYQYLTGKGANLDKLKGLNPNQLAAGWFYEYLKENFHLNDAALADITGVFPQGGSYRKTNVGGRNFRGDYASAYLDNLQDVAEVQAVFAGEMTDAEKKDRESTETLVKKLQQDAKNAQAKITAKNTSTEERNKAYEELANALEGLDANVELLNPMSNKNLVDGTKKLADDIAKTVDKDKLNRARINARSIFARATGGSQGDVPLQPLDPDKNPWGERLEASSTDWKNMTAEQLVNRRKQMKDFVNSIQTDTDVQAVLAEDKALKKAIENGMSSDMRTVIEWYNTERLKIQDELHARHLTNTGDWQDPKKQKAAHKQFKAELDAYLEELDAYYTQRKAEIERARSDEEITEGEAWRRNLKNENEWYNRRAELLKIYAEKSGEVTEAEQQAIVKIIAERTGESEAFVRAMIQKTIGFAKQIAKDSEKGAAMVHDWYADIDLKTQQSMLKSQQAITKQVKFIEDTLAKERPYDGITKNLQDNLDKMGVLAARMRRINDEMTAQGKQPQYSNADITAQSYKEVAFFLNNAADAWSIDINELLQRMTREGMETTAEEISKSELLKQAVMGQLRKTYQEVQDAVKKEASQIKKNVEIIWNDEAQGIGGMSMKSVFDQAIARLGMQQDSVSRANSLIGAGTASDNVASRLAMKQIEVQMRMQKAQFDMYRTQARQRMAALKAEAAEHERIARQMKDEKDFAEEARQKTLATNALRDAENVKRSLGLTLAEETKKEEEQMAELLKLQEESQNRLYTSLKEWADLLASSVQSLFEASNAGNAEYYNELAKLNLTGKGGPGAGTYIVIDNEGTEDAKAHYEYLDERAALERQHEIEQENAQAEAWKKVMDDLNQKMSEQITDWLNAAAQNAALDMNTEAVGDNTSALNGLTGAITSLQGTLTMQNAQQAARQASNNAPNPTIERIGYEDVTPATTTPATTTPATGDQTSPFLPGVTPGISWVLPEDMVAAEQEQLNQRVQMQQEAIDKVRIANEESFHKIQRTSTDTNKTMVSSAQSSFAKMALAANLYGVAYQAMSNDNLSTTQKFEMMALQSVGNFAISSLTAFMSEAVARGVVDEATVLGKLWSQLGWAAAPVFAIFTGLLGAAMGAATSAVSKSKSQIAQTTGASSASAGKLSTGMLTYAEGNVNEFTDPASLTPGKQYNVDAADGRTYRARYMGSNPKTHITNGPEFHLSGERGREMIIDAGTTRQITMNEAEIWHAIQTLSGGGRLRHSQARRSGMRAFADGNVDEFEDMTTDSGFDSGSGMSTEMLASLQASIDRQSDLLEYAIQNGIKAVNKWTGPDGIPNMVNEYNKKAARHGEKYL